MNAWSLIAAWVGVSIPVSFGLGLLLAHGKGRHVTAPRPAPVRAATPTSRVA